MPTFSSLTGGAEAQEDDWCEEHGVPESECVECHPELLPRGKDYGWCPIHGVHNCPLCHPDVAELDATPCVTPADLERARRALALMDRPQNNPRWKFYRRRIQFASEEAMVKAGVGVKVVQERRMVEAVAANGELTYDPTRLARLSTRAPGSIWAVTDAGQVGKHVRAGEVLALVDAAEVGKAKGEFLRAIVEVRLTRETAERLSQVAAQGAVSERSAREAEATLREAEIRLLSAQQALVNLGLPLRGDDMKGLPPDEIARRIQFLGLPEGVRKALDPNTTPANLLPVRAPLDGVVVNRDLVAGEVVDLAKVLFVVADTRRMWLMLNVRQEDARFVALGQPVHFRTDSSGGDAAGEVAWIAPEVDEKTRTLQVRADLPNAEGRLRANTFGAGRVVLRDEPKAVAVPSEAVQWDGNCNVVFVRHKNFLKEGAPKVFHPRSVRVGVRDDDYTEIIAGVLPGEVIAAKGSGVLRGELLKDSLGEG